MEFKTTKQFAKHYSLELVSTPKSAYTTGTHEFNSKDNDIKGSISFGYEDGSCLTFLHLGTNANNGSYSSIRMALSSLSEEIEDYQYSLIKKKTLTIEEVRNLDMKVIVDDFIKSAELLNERDEISISLNCKKVFKRDEVEKEVLYFLSVSNSVYINTILRVMTKKYKEDMTDDFYERYLQLSEYCVKKYAKENYIELTESQEFELTYGIVYDYMIENYSTNVIYDNLDYINNIVRSAVLDKMVFD